MNEEIKSALIRVFPFVLVLIVLFIATKRKKIDINELYLNKPNPMTQFFLWIIGFFIFIILTEVSLYKTGNLEIDSWNHPLIPSIIRIAGMVILAPIMEEIIFRGLIISKLLKKGLNIHVVILIQALLFVLLHNFTYQNSLSSNIAVGQSLVDAVLFGYARKFAKSIFTPITMHMTGNFIATLERFIF